MSGGEVAQDLLGIIADGNDFYAVAVEGHQVALQLNELRLARRSPGGASVKEDQCTLATPSIGKAYEVSELVG